MLLYRPGAVLSLRSVMLEFEAVYTGLPVCSLCLFFETAKLIRHFNVPHRKKDITSVCGQILFAKPGLPVRAGHDFKLPEKKGVFNYSQGVNNADRIFGNRFR